MNEDAGKGRSHDPGFPEGYLAFMREDWRDSSLPGLAALDNAPCHARRREQLSRAYPGETLVIPTGREKVRNNDCFYPFRPNSDFVYLTGEHDPDAVLLLRPTAAGHDAVLYVHPRSPRDTDEFFRNAQYGELWVGRRYSLSEKSTLLDVPTAAIADLEKVLADLDPASTRTLRGVDAVIDAAVPAADDGTRDAALATTLSDLRLVKDEWEIAQLRDAIAITVRGFEDVARILPADRPVSERLLEGAFGARARHEGNAVGYASIVAAGRHATTLHWVRNDGRTTPGELLLMDMGVENNHLYTADVTRTLPVGGTFTPLQRQVYDIVYASQQAGIDAIRPGVKFADVHLTCMRVLAEGLESLGVLDNAEKALDKENLYYRRWSLHGFGHSLGLDVHDCAHATPERYHKGELAEGHVLTCEPGLYFQTDDDKVPAELRGIGIRIEDDILVTADGATNLSADLPRKSEEVETWLAAQRAQGPRLPD